MSNSIDDTFESFKGFIASLRDNCPSTKIFVQSVLPVISTKAKNGKKVNHKIILYNTMIKEFCDGNSFTYIDLWSSYIDKGELNSRLSLDGIHIRPDAYIYWEEKIKPYI